MQYLFLAFIMAKQFAVDFSMQYIYKFCNFWDLFLQGSYILYKAMCEVFFYYFATTTKIKPYSTSFFLKLSLKFCVLVNLDRLSASQTRKVDDKIGS
jgi:hypothetical protein